MCRAHLVVKLHLLDLRVREDFEERRVAAALRAELERLERVRSLAADFACFDNDRCEAPDRPSFFSARLTARERFPEGRRRVERWLLRSFCAAAVSAGGGGNFTPALRAFDNPIAMACFAFLTPCFPSLTW